VEDLHRRVWIGLGAIRSRPICGHRDLAGSHSEFDIATPWTFAVFKSKGGGRAYFHGGLSPQELIVPVVCDALDGEVVTTSSGINGH